MTVREFINKLDNKPDKTYEGTAQAKQRIFAIDLAGDAPSVEQGADLTQAEVENFLVANKRMTEVVGGLEPQMQDAEYVYEGTVSNKTGTKRSVKVTGERVHGDPFQDRVLSHAIKYGTGNEIRRPYALFSVLTGVGETGMMTIAVEEDHGGAAGDPEKFSIAFTAEGKPNPFEYVYAPGA